jgi:tricarballylate dehydrogenase
LLKVTGGSTDETLARWVIRESASCRGWMKKHGVRFQPALSGTLQLSRTNAFFMGGGKALVNAYYRSARLLGVQVRYAAPVDALELDGDRFVAARVGPERIAAKACVLACGGFESNLAWQRQAWGRNERGEWPADNFMVRGTRFNQGVLLKHLIERGADVVGDPSQAHCVACDARGPLYDGGIVTRVDAVSLGVMLNREGLRFYDEGEDFWPKRYAIWGRLIALQPGQIGYNVIDSKAIGRFMPAVFPGLRAQTLPELAAQLGLPVDTAVKTIAEFNAACRSGRFDHTVLDDCATAGLTPPKTHWARPIDQPPFYAYALKPGITFTYLGMKTNTDAAVHFGGRPSANLFVAGEMMAGNVLGRGYTAGVGMSIGTASGRRAGARAAQAASGGPSHAGA